jgi:hypothetical protein
MPAIGIGYGYGDGDGNANEGRPATATVQGNANVNVNVRQRHDKRSQPLKPASFTLCPEASPRERGNEGHETHEWG